MFRDFNEVHLEPVLYCGVIKILPVTPREFFALKVHVTEPPEIFEGQLIESFVCVAVNSGARDVKSSDADFESPLEKVRSTVAV